LVFFEIRTGEIEAVIFFLTNVSSVAELCFKRFEHFDWKYLELGHALISKDLSKFLGRVIVPLPLTVGNAGL